MSKAGALLPRELLRHVLDELEPNPDEPIAVDRRRYLSQESLDRPSPPPRSCIEDIASFRLACKQFADVGAPLLFTRVVTRLSKRDLKRLETLASWRVATHVKRFSYLVPYFFKNHETLEELAVSRTTNYHTQLDLGTLQGKANERQHILNEERDICVLKKAMVAFNSLQHVRILPVADEEQQKLLRLIRQDPSLTRFVELDWTEACYHCSRTIGTALRAARLPEIRFSYPKLSPQNAQFFAQRKLQSISSVAATLTSLTLQFEEVDNMEQEVRDLSGLFKSVFTKAKNMEAIHVGFLSPQPLDLRLEDVFQNVTWNKLVALGIHGWNLHAEEILSLALRHETKLKGLRLRKVFLREGSMWKDVLSQLKDSMSSLEWISLTGIGYVHPPPTGVEMPEGPPDIDNSSGDSDNDDSGYYSHNYINGTGSNPGVTAGPSNHYNANSNSDDEDFYNDADSEEEPRNDIGEIEFLDLDSPNRPLATFSCNCDELTLADTDTALNDNGGPISWYKAKCWERWVVNHCPIHGPR